MCELKDIKIVNLKKKCEALQIKTYGTKLVILDRIKKHYLQNGLGEFNLDQLADARDEEERLSSQPSSQPSSQTSGQAPSILANSQEGTNSTNTFSSVPIQEEHVEVEDEGPPLKKRKTTVSVSYFVSSVCDNEVEALNMIKSENIWANYCRSNDTAHGKKSYYPCKHKGCPKKIG